MQACAQRDRVIASYTLLSAIGRVDVKTLVLNTPDYLPEVHYNQGRDAWHACVRRRGSKRTRCCYRFEGRYLTRRERNEISTGRVTRITSGASIMPVTTTTAKGFCTCDPIPADIAAGNSPTPAMTQVISTGRSCSSPVRITALTRSKPSSIS